MRIVIDDTYGVLETSLELLAIKHAIVGVGPPCGVCERCIQPQELMLSHQKGPGRVKQRVTLGASKFAIASLIDWVYGI
ncbi:hypothetical protein F8G81_09855 [Arthrobacter sp. CDRTa11]|uniref:hypothetical protein n=1 Tax=Arthrobacter sp. CDRTa11 TaxID=2651199 RepID=UPI002265E8D7|nr:hypothetical protein [Arthrobacter sp. CDRTa11]UZX02878.1 hypothetical protein F8G81_09855 [Arthrobacter sp. CDRTa11]